MKEFGITKILGSIVGVATIMLAFGFGLLALLGMGLASAWNTGYQDSSSGSWAMITFLMLMVTGLLTAIGSLSIKNPGRRIIFSAYCFLLGIACIVMFFVSFGAIGLQSELFILGVGVMYLILGYLAKKKR